MSATFTGGKTWCVAAGLTIWAVSAVLAGSATPPPPGQGDLLDEARRREQVAVQKAEADFRASIRELHRLAIANPAAALTRLRSLLAVLDADTVLPSARRTAWKNMVQDRIRVLEAEVAGAARSDAEKTKNQISRDERQALQDQRTQEDVKIREGLNTVRRLNEEGRTEEARRAADDLVRRYPANPALDPARRIRDTAGRLAELRDLRREREARIAMAGLDVERSAIPPRDVIEFPSRAKWDRITKMRSKTNMTEREKAIMKALNSPITVDLRGSKVETVIEYLQTVTGQEIILDKSTQEAAGINYDTTVNTNVKNVALRTLLRKVLGELGLTYVVKNEAIQLVTPQQAREMLTVRTYYLGDLAGVADFTFGPIFGQAQMMQTVAQLVQMITGTIEPDSWAVNNEGGRGTIMFDPRTLTLIVKQSAEVHYMLGGFGR